MIQLEIDLLKTMLRSDLDIAATLVDAGDLAMAENALRNALTKIDQLKALAPQALECGSPMPLSTSAIDV
jgi:hypothetical protein